MSNVHIHISSPFVWSITTVLLLLCISLMPHNVLSQEPYGTILGTVTDSSGAVIPDADTTRILTIYMENIDNLQADQYTSPNIEDCGGTYVPRPSCWHLPADSHYHRV